MLVADSLGRLTAPPPSCPNCLTRKTFLVLCGLGTAVTTAIFSAVFWRSGLTALPSGLPVVLSDVFSNNIFILITLSTYLFFYSIGFGPIKHTLLSELFSPQEQVRLSSFCLPDQSPRDAWLVWYS